MTDNDTFQMIKGIKCYDPASCYTLEDYPGDVIDYSLSIEKTNWWFLSRVRLFTQLLAKISASMRAPCRYLEVACAGGHLLHSLKNNIPHLNITGSDVSLNLLENARKNLPDVELIQLDIRAQHGALAADFNIIGAFDVLEHMQDDEQALQNMHQMLASQGYLLLSVPQYSFMWSQLDVIVKHKRRYTKKELHQKLQQCGFTLCYTTSFIFTLFPAMVFSRLVIDKLRGRHKALDFASFHQSSRYINRLFGYLTRIDEFLVTKGWSLPFGGTLIVLAQKKSS